MVGKILVVDDVERNVKLLEAKLASDYYTVYTAYSGEEAISSAKEHNPDVILLDVMMPGLDGFETCRRLKADADTMLIPVIMVTALSEQSDRVQGLEAGAFDFITKPIDETHLTARVRSLIRLKLMMEELIQRDVTAEKLGLPSRLNFDFNEKLNGNILVIDDDAVQNKNIAQKLTEAGNVITQGDIDVDYKIEAEGMYDLALVSTGLFDVDGLRLAMNLRNQVTSARMPIIIIVDEDEKALLVRAIDLGLDDYIISPIDYSELVARVQTQLKHKKYNDLLRDSYMQTVSASIIDKLTGLYNRRYFEEHFESLINAAKDKKQELAVMLMDIDNFKQINDKDGWGHQVGDEILQQIAKPLQDAVRSTEIAARLGGDEFVLVLPFTSAKNAKVVGERVRFIVENTHFKISGEPGHANVTISIGIAGLKSDADMPKSILERADHALYSAKKQGRNYVFVNE